MIRIHKSKRVPTVLTSKGRGQRARAQKAYDADPAAYKSGDSKLPTPRSDIYSDPSVKKSLLACQHNKCCFSEAPFVGDFGDVEHFRPKGYIVDHETGKKIHPGYYWLAYDWDNLFVCKERPNRSSKRSFFPLRVESRRARSHHDSIGAEEPLLIHPTNDEPRDHIRFHEDEPVAYQGSEKGRTTIDLLNLTHPQLANARRDHLRMVRNLRDMLLLLTKAAPPNNAEAHERIRLAKEELVRLGDKDSPFSSMVTDFFLAHPLP